MSGNSACAASGDAVVRACLRCMQISTTSGFSLLQSPDVGVNGMSYYYPAIQIDANDNLVTVFSGSSASSYASVYASGHLAAAGSGTFQTPALIKAESYRACLRTRARLLGRSQVTCSSRAGPAPRQSP